MESKPKPFSPTHESVAEKDDKAKMAYQHFFDKRRGIMHVLTDLQPCDPVHLKLDH